MAVGASSFGCMQLSFSFGMQLSFSCALVPCARCPHIGGRPQGAGASCVFCSCSTQVMGFQMRVHAGLKLYFPFIQEESDVTHHHL